jgi:hypothetical protein
LKTFPKDELMAKIAILSANRKTLTLYGQPFYFAYCPTTEDFVFCQTEGEALDAAFYKIWDRYDANCAEFDEGVCNIIVGTITHKALEVLIERPKNFESFPLPINADFVDPKTDIHWKPNVLFEKEYEMRRVN